MNADNFISAARHFGYCYVERSSLENVYFVKAKNSLGDSLFWEGASRDDNVSVPRELQQLLIEEAMVEREIREVRNAS